MKRPPGSTIKPLSVYSAAIELGYIMPYTAFNDGADVKLSGTSWYPNNDDYENRGIVTVRQAITKSINTVAAQIIDLIGPSTAYKFLQEKYGFTSLVEGSDASYAPMALGR
jgi:penicillin-binding protein 1A